MKPRIISATERLEALSKTNGATGAVAAMVCQRMNDLENRERHRSLILGLLAIYNTIQAIIMLYAVYKFRISF
jgi:hypothetical protein